MPSASKIIIVRADFTIPGGEVRSSDATSPEAGAKMAFFAMLHANRPDVVVLDLTVNDDAGYEAIRTIRQRTAIPILVVHRADDNRVDDFRVCGAAGCVSAPLDIVALNSAIQRIIELTKVSGDSLARLAKSFSFGGITFYPDRCVLEGSNGFNVKLTSMEKDLLSHLASRARTVCSRTEIAHVLYGDHPPATDRAVDVMVNRLRKKMATVGGEFGVGVLRTEFRRGYVFTSDVLE
jgi:DNA-binding response OmpR family regulator